MLKFFDCTYNELFTLKENQIKAWLLSYYFPYEKAKYCLPYPLSYTEYIRMMERAYYYIYYTVQDLRLYSTVEFDLLDYFDTGKNQCIQVWVDKEEN